MILKGERSIADEGFANSIVDKLKLQSHIRLTTGLMIGTTSIFRNLGGMCPTWARITDLNTGDELLKLELQKGNASLVVEHKNYAAINELYIKA